jgi:hypothetical protein
MLDPVKGLRNVPMVTMMRITPRESLFAESGIRSSQGTVRKNTDYRDEIIYSGF